MKYFKQFCLLLTVLAAAGCATSKEILYFQDLDEAKYKNIELQEDYEAVIKQDDRLSIVISGTNKLVTAPFNLTISEMSTTGGGYSSNPEQATLTYLVDADGNINFPGLGTLHVAGLTRNGLVQMLTERLVGYVQDPVVYVAFKNYKITVLGEVKAPGTYTVESEKINVLQALGLAGDLNLTAQREGIVLLREAAGHMEHYTIDLRQSNLMESPYFYLQQNDVIYVPASALRVANATLPTGLLSVGLSSFSAIVALLALIK